MDKLNAASYFASSFGHIKWLVLEHLVGGALFSLTRKFRRSCMRLAEEVGGVGCMLSCFALHAIVTELLLPLHLEPKRKKRKTSKSSEKSTAKSNGAKSNGKSSHIKKVIRKGTVPVDDQCHLADNYHVLEEANGDKWDCLLNQVCAFAVITDVVHS